MTFLIGYPPSWDEQLDAMDERELASLEEQEARIDAGDGLDA